MKEKRHKIKLVFWNNSPNFGDALSPWLVSKLTNATIIEKQHYSSIRISFKTLIYNLLHLKLSSIKKILWPWENNFIAVGSVITYGNSNSTIWGSGYMSYSEHTIKPHKVLAVRGKYSAKKLFAEHRINCETFGDPALLLSLLIPPAPKVYKIGIIPHWKEVEFFKSTYGNDYLIIDLRTTDIEQIVSQITSCYCTLCSSLHGIIVSHAYNIPSLWIKMGNIGTDGFKFYDYFSSVGINNYDGFSTEIIRNFDEHFKKNSSLALPSIDIANIQKGLLDCFPFKQTRRLL